MCWTGLAAQLCLILVVPQLVCSATWSGGENGITLGGEVLVSSAPPELAHEVVKLAYRGILGRDPDVGGLQNYVQHLHDRHRHRGIVWLCSILLESAEFNSNVGKPQGLVEIDLAKQLHRGIEGCAEAEPVKTTHRLLVRARSMTGRTRKTLGLIASRAAFMIAHTTGALLWSEASESDTLWSVASAFHSLERGAQFMLTVLQEMLLSVVARLRTAQSCALMFGPDLLFGMARTTSSGLVDKHIEQRFTLRAC